VSEDVSRVSLREESAFQLANVTKTAPQFGAITPRWLVRLLDWKPLEAGTFRAAATKTNPRWPRPSSNTTNHPVNTG
jgi:hypothetical protein